MRVDGEGARMSAGVAVRRLSSMLVAVCAAAFCVAARAQDVPGYPAHVTDYDPREVAMLPRYCIHTQSFRDKVPGGADKVAIDGWYAEMGPVFHAMHHYCWGLMKTHRALYLSRDPRTREFYLRDSITEFDYVLERAANDFVLLPEILTKKGENLIRLGRGATGIYELERAVELKPEYWPPYAQMSDYYKEAGDRKKARDMLQAGLAKAPDAKALQRRLAELDSADRRATKR
jgi:hypothetical protein